MKKKTIWIAIISLIVLVGTVTVAYNIGKSSSKTDEISPTLTPTQTSSVSNTTPLYDDTGAYVEFPEYGLHSRFYVIKPLAQGVDKFNKEIKLANGKILIVSVENGKITINGNARKSNEYHGGALPITFGIGDVYNDDNLVEIFSNQYQPSDTAMTCVWHYDFSKNVFLENEDVLSWGFGDEEREITWYTDGNGALINTFDLMGTNVIFEYYETYDNGELRFSENKYTYPSAGIPIENIEGKQAYFKEITTKTIFDEFDKKSIEHNYEGEFSDEKSWGAKSITLNQYDKLEVLGIKSLRDGFASPIYLVKLNNKLRIMSTRSLWYLFVS